jgi:monoamine oxidase
LNQAGHEVAVFEARDRVGGRVHSVRLANGEVAELGGEWIKEDQRFVVGLARELGVPMAEVGVDFSKRDLIGSPPIDEEEHRRVAAVVGTAIAELSDARRSEMTAGDLFSNLDDGSDAFRVLRNRIEGSAGVAADRIGVEEVIGDFGLGEATYLRVESGNQSLAEAIVTQLTDVRVGQPVTEIGSTHSGVSVVTLAERFEVAGVVISVPLPLISKLRFDPPLPRAILDAIARLGMGTAAKLAAPTRSGPSLVALQDSEATWWCWTGAGPDGKTRKVVTAFAGTQSAIDAVSDGWQDRLTEALPEIRFGTDSATMDWGLEEWSGGCYSALGPGDEVLLGVFEEEGPVVFAGEHTLGAGTIDGAIESGDRAAERLGRFLARTTASH